MNPIFAVFLYGLVTALATGLGALPFVFVKELSPFARASAHGLAAGLMLGACFGLVAEGTEAGATETMAGGVLGVLGILAARRWLNDRPIEFGGMSGAGARQMLLLIAVMTAHSFSEGVAVGVAFGGGTTLAATITVAIAVHNVPEGLAISAVMRSRNQPVAVCAAWSIFSSLPQPLMAVPAFLLVETVRPVLPYGLGFAAGAMAFVVLDALLPDAFEQGPKPAVALLASVSVVAMILFQHAL